eukprot:scaffold45158_cov161-Skeletonema_marinoi.AAC.1
MGSALENQMPALSLLLIFQLSTDATSTQQAPEAGATLSLFSFSVAQATIFVSLEDHCCHYSPSWYFLTAMHHGTCAPSDDEAVVEV